MGNHNTKDKLIILPLQIYDGILGMEWLAHNNTSISCKNGQMRFKIAKGSEVVIPATRGDHKLHFVTATKLLKAYRKKHMIYGVKSNPLDKPKPQNKLVWLHHYNDIFPEDLTELLLEREVDHAVDLIQ